MSTVLVASLALATACGKASVPTERLGRAEGAVRSARETNAASEPSAALQLRLAQEELAHGKNLIERGENERASYVLMRAEADAELARNLHDEANSRQQAQSVIAEVQALRNAAGSEEVR
jgi:hypothetical protein